MHSVALFQSVSHVMKAEKILQKADIPFKLIPVPKTISSECGVCIRFDKCLMENIKEALNGTVDITAIIPYN